MNAAVDLVTKGMALTAPRMVPVKASFVTRMPTAAEFSLKESKSASVERVGRVTVVLALI